MNGIGYTHGCVSSRAKGVKLNGIECKFMFKTRAVPRYRLETSTEFGRKLPRASLVVVVKVNSLLYPQAHSPVQYAFLLLLLLRLRLLVVVLQHHVAMQPPLHPSWPAPSVFGRNVW
jgi:hypothetical protein